MRFCVMIVRGNGCRESVRNSWDEVYRVAGLNCSIRGNPGGAVCGLSVVCFRKWLARALAILLCPLRPASYNTAAI